MSENEFSEVISSARKRASDRAAEKAAHAESHQASIKSKREVLHTLVNRTLHQAWRDLEAAGIQASIDTSTNSRGDWQMSLKLPTHPSAPLLVFTVLALPGGHLAYSKEHPHRPGEVVEYTQIDDATPVEIARIVAEHLAETLG